MLLLQCGCIRWCTPLDTGRLYRPSLQSLDLEGHDRIDKVIKEAICQTEPLLYEALRLELHPLVDCVLAYVVSCTHRPDAIFYAW